MDAVFQAAKDKAPATKSGRQDRTGTLGVDVGAVRACDRGRILDAAVASSRHAFAAAKVGEDSDDVEEEHNKDAIEQEGMLDAEALDRSWSHSAGLGGRDAQESGAEDDWRRGQEASDVLSNTQEQESSDNQEVRGARDSERDGTSLLTHSRHSAKLTSAQQKVKTALRSVDAAAIKWSGRGEFVGWGGVWGLGVGAGRDLELDSGGVGPFSARATRTTSRVTRSMQLVRPACCNSACSLTCMRLQYTQSSHRLRLCVCCSYAHVCGAQRQESCCRQLVEDLGKHRARSLASSQRAQPSDRVLADHEPKRAKVAREEIGCGQGARQPPQPAASKSGNASRLVHMREQAEAAWCGCLVNGKGQREALRLYKKAMMQDGSRDVALLCSYANFARQHRDLPRAAAELSLQQAIDIDPYSSEALCEYADMLLGFGGQGERALAIQLLDRIFSGGPGAAEPVEEEHGRENACFQARARYLYGWALVAEGDRQGGEAVLLSVAEDSSNRPLTPSSQTSTSSASMIGVAAAAWGTLGLLALRCGEWSVAERRLQSALALGLEAVAAFRYGADEARAASSTGARGGDHARAGVFPRNLTELRLVVVVVRVLCRYGDLLAGVWRDMPAAVAMYDHAASLLPYAAEIHIQLAGLHVWTASGSNDPGGEGSELESGRGGGGTDHEQRRRSKGRTMTDKSCQSGRGVVHGIEIMTELIKKNGRDSHSVVQHAILLSREEGMHDRAERLLQHAVDLCSPRLSTDRRSSSASSDDDSMSPQAAAEYALVLRRYFDFLLGIRGDLRQCAHVLTILASLDRALGVDLPEGERGWRNMLSAVGGGLGNAAGAGRRKARAGKELSGEENLAETRYCQRRISAAYLVCSARFHWLLSLRKGVTQGSGGYGGAPAKGEDAGEQEGWVMEGNVVTRKSLLETAASLLISAYGVAVGSGCESKARTATDREVLDLDTLAGEVMASLGWVALEKGQYRDVEKYVAMALRHRGLMSTLRPVSVDGGEAEGDGE